jgi:hypothetical protein
MILNWFSREDELEYNEKVINLNTKKIAGFFNKTIFFFEIK